MGAEGVIIAVLSLVGTLSGSFFANRKSAALVAYRLQELEKKVDKHNNVIERTYKLEKDMAVAQQRLEELEEKKGGVKNGTAKRIF